MVFDLLKVMASYGIYAKDALSSHFSMVNLFVKNVTQAENTQMKAEKRLKI